MHGDALIIVLVLIFGCAAFFFGLIYAACRLITWMAGGLWGVFRPQGPRAAIASRAGGGSARTCSRYRCRKVECRREARYCSQCGAPLPNGFERRKSARAS